MLKLLTQVQNMVGGRVRILTNIVCVCVRVHMHVCIYMNKYIFHLVSEFSLYSYDVLTTIINSYMNI